MGPTKVLETGKLNPTKISNSAKALLQRQPQCRARRTVDDRRMNSRREIFPAAKSAIKNSALGHCLPSLVLRTGYFDLEPIRIWLCLAQMSGACDLYQELRPHQFGLDAVASRRLIWKILAIDVVHRLIMSHIGQKDLVENHTLDLRPTGLDDALNSSILEYLAGLGASIADSDRVSVFVERNIDPTHRSYHQRERPENRVRGAAAILLGNIGVFGIVSSDSNAPYRAGCRKDLKADSAFWATWCCRTSNAIGGAHTATPRR